MKVFPKQELKWKCTYEKHPSCDHLIYSLLKKTLIGSFLWCMFDMIWDSTIYSCIYCTVCNSQPEMHLWGHTGLWISWTEMPRSFHSPSWVLDTHWKGGRIYHALPPLAASGWSRESDYWYCRSLESSPSSNTHLSLAPAGTHRERKGCCCCCFWSKSNYQEYCSLITAESGIRFQLTECTLI